LGGTVTIHAFGAYFGLGLSAIMFYKLPKVRATEDIHKDLKQSERDRQPNYVSNIFAMLGTLVMFVMWPAFVVAFAPDGSQFRVIINTVLSMTSSCIFAFIASRTFRGGKFSMMDLQRATLAGMSMLFTLEGRLLTLLILFRRCCYRIVHCCSDHPRRLNGSRQYRGSGKHIELCLHLPDP